MPRACLARRAETWLRLRVSFCIIMHAHVVRNFGLKFRSPFAEAQPGLSRNIYSQSFNISLVVIATRYLAISRPLRLRSSSDCVALRPPKEAHVLEGHIVNRVVLPHHTGYNASIWLRATHHTARVSPRGNCRIKHLVGGRMFGKDIAQVDSVLAGLNVELSAPVAQGYWQDAFITLRGLLRNMAFATCKD